MQKEQNTEVYFLYQEFLENFRTIFSYGLEQIVALGPTADGRNGLLPAFSFSIFDLIAYT